MPPYLRAQGHPNDGCGQPEPICNDQSALKIKRLAKEVNH
jgi:hypothetical protein